MLSNSLHEFKTIAYNGSRGRYVHEISVVLMVIVITLQSQLASLAQKSARNYSASRHECRWMFTESKVDETFRVIYINLYSMAARRDIDRTYKCVSEWRFFLVKAAFAQLFCPVFDNLMNVLPEYQRYSWKL